MDLVNNTSCDILVLLSIHVYLKQIIAYGVASKEAPI
jgi:hypothetical protein